MPRELITVQVGQAGNQIGGGFWELALREHASTNRAKVPVYDEAMSSFFRNVDARRGDAPLPVGSPVAALKARAVCVDMEEGVLSAMTRGPLGELFDAQRYVTSSGGSGNNWAEGHIGYGPEYEEAILDAVRVAAEACDSLQSFFIIHSLGGGTGSGLGTYVLGRLADAYPDVIRFASVVFPSDDDDVITSPYNSVLALNELTEHADCVMPIANSSLASMAALWDSAKAKTRGKAAAGGDSSAWGTMNAIGASLLTHLTASMRFEGSLNIDLNEITMNLVPFPRLQYLLSSLAPLTPPGADVRLQTRSLNQMFTDALSPHQLMPVDPKRSTFLACAFMMRGDVTISDAIRTVERVRNTLCTAHWNPDAFKLGLCDVPPAGQKYSVLTLANNCAIRHPFRDLMTRFMKLYRARAHVHHYTKAGMDEAQMHHAAVSLDTLCNEYESLEANEEAPGGSSRMRIAPQ